MNTPVVDVHWPMTIPAHAPFLITSPYPLHVSFPHNVRFKLTLHTPIHLSSPSPVHIIPSGPLSPGFTRGWTRLPTELQLAILRHNTTYPSAIWPANANAVMRKSLFPYLRMTPEIAALSRSLFFAQKTFITLPLQEELSVLRGFPPPSVRPLLRRIKVLTWCEPGDWSTIRAIAQRELGFEGLTHVEVRCSVVRLVRMFVDPLAGGDDGGGWEAYAQRNAPPEVGFRTKGRVVFDRLEFPRGGMTKKLLERVDEVERLVREKISFEG